uniref:Uncharacterized protein n=1 Tax=Setaria viridis TaxID=4556 RepID=A0A4U6U4K7_SETVI|nr:hypothetical protein SEVIR_6G017800v2 [Setaria viridis]
MGYTGGLKREREEEEEQQHGVPRASRPAPPPPAGRPLLPFEEPIRFVLAVRREFAAEPGKILEFTAVMRGFRLGRFGVDGVVSRLQVLFRGHPELIRGFNPFLPPGYELRDDDRQGGGDGADA